MAEKIRHNEIPSAEAYESATLLLSDIQDFTKNLQDSSPLEVKWLRLYSTLLVAGSQIKENYIAGS